MKENKNTTLLTTLKALNVDKLKDDELTKISKNISNTINVNGLRRNVNTALIQIIENENTSMDNNKKIEFIKNLLNNQKIIENNVRNFRRKSALPSDVKDMITFTKITTETLKLVERYQPLKEEKTSKKAKEIETKRTTPSSKVSNNTKK